MKKQTMESKNQEQKNNIWDDQMSIRIGHMRERQEYSGKISKKE